MDTEQTVELTVSGQQLMFALSLHRECHLFRCTNATLPDVIVFKYDTDGPWYCFSPVDANVKALLIQYCIDHYASSPGYNQFVGKDE